MPLVLDARTATDHFPGIGRYVVNLANALAPLVPAQTLRLLQAPATTAARQALPDLPGAVCPASPFSLSQQWVVPAQLRHLRARLYHSPYYLMPYAPGVPTVLTCYDLIPLIYPAYFSPLQRLIYWAAQLLATRTATVILSISESTKTDLVHRLRLAPQKIEVTPLAAAPHFEPQTPEQVRRMRQQYALPEKYVLYFGSNKPHKNLGRLVQAFMRLKTSPPLVIAGHWDHRYPEAKRLVEAADAQSRVRFIGAVAEADLPALYSGATLFVFPSEYEGFGLPVLEAMACGAPVACSHTSSLPEVAGTAAWYFNPHNVNEIAATLQQALAEGLAGRQAHSLIQAQKFSWSHTAQLTLKVYEQLSAAQ